MKKIYTIALSLLIGSLLAQNSFGVFYVGTTNFIAPNTIIKTSSIPLSKTTVSLDIRNTSNTSHTYNVKRYDLVLHKSSVDTAKAFFCFAGTCYGPDVTEGQDPLVLSAGKSAAEAGVDAGLPYFTLDADLTEASTIGVSHVKYTFFDVNNKADSIQLYIAYNDPYVGVKDVVKKSSRIELFPNPGSDFTTITLESANDQAAELKVISSIGTVVYEKHIASLSGKHSFDVNLQNLAAGVYFVQLKEGNNNTVKKLVVQK